MTKTISEINICRRITRVIDKAALLSGVPALRICSRRRNDRLCKVRYACFLVLRREPDLTLSEIGEAFGGRDHGTVIHGIYRARQLLQRDTWFAALVHKLSTQS